MCFASHVCKRKRQTNPACSPVELQVKSRFIGDSDRTRPAIDRSAVVRKGRTILRRKGGSIPDLASFRQAGISSIVGEYGKHCVGWRSGQKPPLTPTRPTSSWPLDFGQKSQAAAAKARDFQASLKPRGARTLLFSIISWRRRARRSRQEGRSAVRRHLGKAR